GGQHARDRSRPVAGADREQRPPGRARPRVVHHAGPDCLGARTRRADRRRDRCPGGGLSDLARQEGVRGSGARAGVEEPTLIWPWISPTTRSARSATFGEWLTTSTVIP